jgi:hypothetical protein
MDYYLIPIEYEETNMSRTIIKTSWLSIFFFILFGSNAFRSEGKTPFVLLSMMPMFMKRTFIVQHEKWG